MLGCFGNFATTGQPVGVVLGEPRRAVEALDGEGTKLVNLEWPQAQTVTQPFSAGAANPTPGVALLRRGELSGQIRLAPHKHRTAKLLEMGPGEAAARAKTAVVDRPLPI